MNNKDMKIVKKKIKEPLSNFDLVRAITKDMKIRGNVYDTRDIDSANDIEDIFKGRAHTILFEENPNPNEDIGHFTVLLRNHGNGGTCIYFDSYGDRLKNQKLRQILGSKYHTIQYNPHRFQDYGDSSCCGRYALSGVALNKIIPDLNVLDIVNFLKNKPKKLSYDEYITYLTKEV